MVRSLLSFVTLVALAAGPVQASSQDPAAANRATGAAVAIVNLNTATSAELQALPGIGPATATRILEYRQKHGPFKKIEEVMNVQGVGEKIFLRLKPQLSVGTAAVPAAR
jgi:competence protein ComEA